MFFLFLGLQFACGWIEARVAGLVLLNGRSPSVLETLPFQSVGMIPALAAGILLSRQAGWLPPSAHWLGLAWTHWLGLAVCVGLAAPVALFTVIPWSSLVNWLADSAERNGSAADYVAAASWMVPASAPAVLLAACHRFITGSWDLPVLGAMLCAVPAAYILWSVLDSAAEHNPFGLGLVSVVSALWVGCGGWALLRGA